MNKQSRFGQHYQKPLKSWRIANAEIYALISHVHLKGMLLCVQNFVVAKDIVLKLIR